jgi:hypothetical protein
MGESVLVHRKGDKQDVKIYRPISLLSIAGKIMEHCIYHLVFPIVKNDFLKHQHGFMRIRSTTTQFVEFYDNNFENADNKVQSDVIYLDLSIAFCCVPLNLLVQILKTFEINCRLLSWFSNWFKQYFIQAIS